MTQIPRRCQGITPGYRPVAGETVDARRSPVDEYTQALVLDAQENRAGKLRVKLMWLEDNFPPAVGHPCEAGTEGWVVAADWPPLIRRIN